MRKVLLRMKEHEKYEAIKAFVDHGGNKLRLSIKLGLSVRQVDRLISKYKREGKEGFIHGNRFHSPANKLSADFSNKIIQLAKHKYKGENENTLICNFKHFKDLLQRDEGLVVSYSTIYGLLMSNGIRSPRIQRITRKNIKKAEKLAKTTDVNEEELEKEINHEIALEDAHPRQERMKYFGELAQMDACSQYWNSDQKFHLHLAVDNCTGNVIGGYFDYQETLFGYYNVFNQILTNYGIPCKFKTDKRTVFTYESKRKKEDENDTLTQFAYACKTLGVELETTSVAESKGQVEKLNDTFQDRLKAEMKLLNIKTIEDANRYLIEVFIPNYNKQFGISIDKVKSVFEDVDKNMIDYYLSKISRRKVDKGCCISYKAEYFAFYRENGERVMFSSGTKCTVISTFKNELFANVDGEIYFLKRINKNADYSSRFDDEISKQIIAKKPAIPPMNHPWRYSNYDSFQEAYKINKYNLR